MKEKPNMSKLFKTTRLKINPEIAPGICPHCEETSTFVSVFNERYRCMNCGSDVEQKINGAIRYLPLGSDIRLGHGPKES
jgi:transposase-like protein